jgi:integrase
VKAYAEHGGYYAMARVGKGRSGRLKLHLLHVKDLAEAQALADRIEAVLGLLEAAGQPSDVRRDTALRLADSPREQVDAIERFARTRLASREYVRPVREVLTVRQFGERWTSGQLAVQYRGIVRPQQRAHKIRGQFEKWVYPLLQDLPVAAVRLEDIEAVADQITTPRLTTKKLILSKVRQLFALAVYPAKQRPDNPVPKELLAIEDDRRAFGWLRPAEVARLLGCTAIPLDRRLCWGVMVHEGLRPEDACELRWSQIDLEHGTISLAKHKTAHKMGARFWALQPDVLAALRCQREEEPDARTPWLVPLKGLAAQLRADLLLAGVTRPELHETTATQRQLRAHDLRATFVTLALADGRSETWVTDRTGHLNARTLLTYRRQARTAHDLGLGWLRPLDMAIPEWGGAPGDAGQASRGASNPAAQSCSQQSQNVGGEASFGTSRCSRLTASAPPEGQKGRQIEGAAAASARCEQPASRPLGRPRRPLRRVGVSARRAAQSGLLTARLERAAAEVRA